MRLGVVCVVFEIIGERLGVFAECVEKMGIPSDLIEVTPNTVS
jgi:hypothetical protein